DQQTRSRGFGTAFVAAVDSLAQAGSPVPPLVFLGLLALFVPNPGFPAAPENDCRYPTPIAGIRLGCDTSYLWCISVGLESRHDQWRLSAQPLAPLAAPQLSPLPSVHTETPPGKGTLPFLALVYSSSFCPRSGEDPQVIARPAGIPKRRVG